MLCSSCSKLGLSPERFQFADNIELTPQEIGGSKHKFCHGFKRKLHPNNSCEFCGLIFKLVKASVAENITKNLLRIWTPQNAVATWIFQTILRIAEFLHFIYHYDNECRIEWITEGLIERTKDSGKVARTRNYVPTSRRRRIRVSWGKSDQSMNSKSKAWEELYLLYVPPQNLSLLEKGNNFPRDKDIDFLAQNSNKDIYAWIRSWIRHCEKEHQNVYRPTEVNDRKAFLDLVQGGWFCVVDVEKMCLAPLKVNEKDEPEAYAALSYVWGTGHEKNRQKGRSNSNMQLDHRTLKSNIHKRQNDHGLNIEKLPRTIQDAIKLVKNLGQNHKIRFIWIDSLCILQDDISSWKLNAEKMDLIFGNASFTICAADGDSNSGLLALNPEKRSTVLTAKINNDLELLVSRSPEAIIQRSRWSTRGWTFQERILSRRCVVFAGGKIYLQCREDNYDESNMSWSSDWRKSPLCIVQNLQHCPIWFYTTSVELYTGRNLTKSTDILKAFNGVSRIVEEHMCAPFLFGLPSSHFDFALLWKPKFGKERRPGDPQEDAVFPSWSWSGWQDTSPEKGSTVYYSSDFLEGCLLDLHDWLIHHTWIVWYIRDEKGSLEPLWQGYNENYIKRLKEVEERWQGYANKWDPNINEDGNDVYAYGRQFHPYNPFDPSLTRTKFKETLPSNAFSVRVDRGRKKNYKPILQFWTWKSEFYIVLNTDSPSPGAGLARLDVLDKHRIWCGTVVVDESWARDNNDKLCEFIALSDARRFMPEECTSWTYPVPMNLEDIEWDLYYVMLVTHFEDRRVWERKGLGKILKVMFDTEDQKWAEILLQ